MGPFIVIVSILLFSMLWQTFSSKQQQEQQSGKHFANSEDVEASEQNQKVA